MTENSFDKFRDVGSPQSAGTIPSDGGVHRRTIVQGAVWTVPVVAVAVATPAAAASTTPTLYFTQSSYADCSTITGVQVKRTIGPTTPDADQIVTVMLKDGYTFADGSTTYSGITDTNGLITLPNITVPPSGGTSNFNATSTTLSTSAPVSADPAAGTGIFRYTASTTTTSGPVDSSSTAINIFTNPSIGDFNFQNEDGSFHDASGRDINAPRSTAGAETSPALVAFNSTSSGLVISYKKSDGIYRYNFSTWMTNGPIRNTSNAVKLIANPDDGAFAFQNSDGSIYFDPTEVVPNSTGADTSEDLTSFDTENGIAITYKKSDGLYRYNAATLKMTGPIANSSTAVKIITNPNTGGVLFQNSDGSIRDLSGALAVPDSQGSDTSSVLTALNGDRSRTGRVLTYKKPDGLYRYNFKTKTTTGPITTSMDAVKLLTNANSDVFLYQNSDGSIRGLSGAIEIPDSTGAETSPELTGMNDINGLVVSYKKSPVCA